MRLLLVQAVPDTVLIGDDQRVHCCTGRVDRAMYGEGVWMTAKERHQAGTVAIEVAYVVQNYSHARSRAGKKESFQ